MHDVLRERILRNLEALPEEQLYQAMDYIEFLGSKYARHGVRQPHALQRFSEVLEDKMRAQGLAIGTIRGTLGLMGTANRMVSGITEAGRTVLREVEQVVLTREDEEPPQGGAVRQADGDPRSGPPAV